MTLAEQLRDACDKVRLKSYPLSDLIPLMQKAADALDAKAPEESPFCYRKGGSSHPCNCRQRCARISPYTDEAVDIRIGMLAADALGAG